MNIKTKQMSLKDIKNSDGWSELLWFLLFDKFKEKHPDLDEEEELPDRFYTDVISKVFKYGEFANLIIEVDENLKIVGGYIQPNDDKFLEMLK